MTAELQGEFVNCCPKCPDKGLLVDYSQCLVEIIDTLHTVDRESSEMADTLQDIGQRLLYGVAVGVEPLFVAEMDQQYSDAMQAYVTIQGYVAQCLIEFDLLKLTLVGTNCNTAQSCPKLSIIQDYTRTHKL